MEASVDLDDLPASVEIDALYYIDSNYLRNWRHGNAVVLIGPGGRNSLKTTDEAFTHYLGWFALVRRIGLERARAEGVRPLGGSQLNWQ